MGYTQLNESYWRHVIRVRGRSWARLHFNSIFIKSKGVRRYELQCTYLKVFRELPAGGDE